MGHLWIAREYLKHTVPGDWGHVISEYMISDNPVTHVLVAVPGRERGEGARKSVRGAFKSEKTKGD